MTDNKPISGREITAEQVEKWKKQWEAVDRAFLYKAAGSPAIRCATHPEPVGGQIDRANGTHWISVSMRRLPGKKMPVMPRAIAPYGYEYRPYENEPVNAKLTDGPLQPELDGWGELSISGIPAGTCSFLFDQFYDPIEAYLKDRTSG